MDEMTILTLLFFGFLAAFIDAVVGGGGLISIPALLATGLPPAAAVATNKLASTMGALTSTIAFIRAGKVDFRLTGKLFPLALIGSLLGATTVQFISSDVLKPLILFLLILVALFTVFKKNWGTVSTYRKMETKKAVLFVAAIFIIGFYDGFLGAGTGSFMLFAFLLIGFDFMQSAGNAKLLNFGSNIAALLLFLYMDMVYVPYGLVMGGAMILGALAGSRFAIQKGTSYVRALFILVTVSLIGKNIYDFLFPH